MGGVAKLAKLVKLGPEIGIDGTEFSKGDPL